LLVHWIPPLHPNALGVALKAPNTTNTLPPKKPNPRARACRSALPCGPASGPCCAAPKAPSRKGAAGSSAARGCRRWGLPLGSTALLTLLPYALAAMNLAGQLAKGGVSCRPHPASGGPGWIQV
jgi:hypothetical protein